MNAATARHASGPANGTPLAEGLAASMPVDAGAVPSPAEDPGIEVEPVDIALAPLPADTVVEVRTEVERLRALIEEALLRQRDQLAAARERLEAQRVEIARLREQVRQHEALSRARVEAVHQQARTLAQANAQFRAALADRDRRLVLFARKVEQLRGRHATRANRRRALLAQLRQTAWWQTGQRQRILAQLEALEDDA